MRIETGARPSEGRVNEIDLLRFIAALAVVFFHYAFRGYAADGLSKMPYPLLAPLAKYGYLGVELFFMISGFVILMTAASGSLKRFVISRVVRLYPAFWACCTITFAMALWLGSPDGEVSWKQYLVNMTLLSEFVGVQDIDGVYWSLFVEIRFYAGVALLLLFGQIGNAQRWLGAWLLVAAVLTALPALPMVPFLRIWLIADYAPLFVAGAVCYLVWQQSGTRERWLLLALCWGLAMAGALRETSQFAQHYHEPMNRLVVGALITAFFGIMVLIATRRTGALGRRRWVLVGSLTYPLYLIHQNIGYMLFNQGYPAYDEHLLLWGRIALMLGAAYLIHVLVERPLGNALKRGLTRLH